MASRSRIQDSNTLEYFDFCAVRVATVDSCFALFGACHSTCFGGQVSTKYETRYRKRVNFAINLRSDLCAGAILICYTVLTSPKKGETAVHGCNPTLSVSVVLVSRKVNFFK